jgi:hypothetical protein
MGTGTLNNFAARYRDMDARPFLAMAVHYLEWRNIAPRCYQNEL